jgi:hypothetical protein
VIDATVERRELTHRGRAGNRGFVATLLFPRIAARFSIALLLTFFPLGILYPLDYPAGELLTLCCWIWVFPSTIGWLSLALLPVIVNATYGYYAFNLFCLVATLSVAWAASRSAEFAAKDLVYLYKFTRVCMFITLAIAGVQAITDPYSWMSVFSNIRLEAGRGAGLKSEPSQLASLVALYLVLLVCRMEYVRSTTQALQVQRSLLREGIWAILLTVALTRSFTVLIIVVCFAPVLFMQRKHFLLTASALLTGGLVGVSVLGDRIGEAFDTSGGSMTDLVTASIGSWRNIPDILILSNIPDFLFLGNPSEVRIKITACAVQLSPVLGWIQNTFTTFSAGGVTVGVLATAALFVAGIALGVKGLSSDRPRRVTWIMLYLAAWIILAKWDPAAWVALGLIPTMHKLNFPGSSKIPQQISMRTGMNERINDGSE